MSAVHNFIERYFSTMPALNLRENLKRAFDAVGIPEMESPSKAICALMQFSGGLTLATCTFQTSSETLFHLGVGIAVGGAMDFNRFTKRKSRFSFPFERFRKLELANFVSGMFSYLTGVYVISGHVQQKLMWIPCGALIVSGYHFATSSINSLDRRLEARALLKCCQLMFEPALTACGAAYVFNFKNNSEGWLRCLPFIATAITGFKLIRRGYVKSDYYFGRKLLLTKGTEMCVGGCLVCISCAALARTTVDLIWPWTSALLCYSSVFGVSMIYRSLFCFQKHLEVERNLLVSMVGMTVGPLAFSAGWLMVVFMKRTTVLLLAFMFLVTGGQAILAYSLLLLYASNPRQVFGTCCRRVFGPIVAVKSSILSAYIAHKIGWRYSLLTLPFVPAGICVACRGFKEKIRPSGL